MMGPGSYLPGFFVFWRFWFSDAVISTRCEERSAVSFDYAQHD